MSKENVEVFKCPKCGEPTWDDPFGYSPSVPYCKKCKHICDWECPEAERLGFADEGEYKSYLKGKKEAKEQILMDIKSLANLMAENTVVGKVIDRDKFQKELEQLKKIK